MKQDQNLKGTKDRKKNLNNLDKIKKNQKNKDQNNSKKSSNKNAFSVKNKRINIKEKKAELVKEKNQKKNAEVKFIEKKSKGKKLKIIFLGGVGEIGKNMTAIEYDKEIIVIDSGVSFPTPDMPGVDLVMQDISYLLENKHKVKAIIITHGHEDHIGSLPFVLKDLNVPVYATKLTLTLIENKLKERRIFNAILNCISAGSTVKLGAISVEFVNVNHSIAGAVALSITTPVGVIFHSGDFKIDYTPVNGDTTNLARMAEIGENGVLLLMADSTNVEIEGTTMSESVVKDTLEYYFNINKTKRLIIATFASNVHRLQQILDLAVQYKRKVAFSGRSMINIVDSAEKIGELSVREGLIVDVEKIKNYKDSELVIITTGTQGEPMSALTRMASGEFSKVTVGKNDTVIISASVIPGNEKMLYNVINNLYRLGAEVIYESLEPIHVSGHACKGELRILHSLIKPKFFIPVHGEYRHLKEHANLAVSLGMNENNIILADIGDSIVLDKNTITKGERVKAGSKYIEGVTGDGADSFILRDRLRLAEEGVVVAILSLDEFSYEIHSLEIICKGLVADETYVSQIKSNLINGIKNIDLKKLGDKNEISLVVLKNVKNFIFKTLKKNPIILPVVMVD